MASRIDKFGTPEAYNHYAVGWAHAMDTPYQWTKQVASHWGGTRNGTIVRWPTGIKAKGELRHQFHHVIDVAPTVLEAAGLPAPDVRERHPAGAARGRLDGLLVRRRRRAGPPHHPVLRDVRQPRHLPPGLDGGDPPPHPVGHRRRCRPSTTTSGSCTRPTTGPRRTTCAAEQPDKLAHLQRLFLIEAGKYNVLPLDDRRVERFNPDLAGRPQLIHGNRQMLFGGMGRLTENSVVVMKNKSYAITAQVDVPDGGGHGTIVAQGGAFGGWTPLPARRQAGLLLQPVRPAALQGGRARPGRGGRAPGPGRVHLRRWRPRQGRDGGPVRRRQPRSARAASTATVPMVFSADETTDLGQRHRHPGDGRPRGGQDGVHRSREVGRARHRRRRRATTTTSSPRRSATASRWLANKSSR